MILLLLIPMPWPEKVRCLPYAVHGSRGHGLRVLAYPAAPVATGGLPALHSKRGISAHQLQGVLEITYKSAWFWRTGSVR